MTVYTEASGEGTGCRTPQPAQGQQLMYRGIHGYKGDFVGFKRKFANIKNSGIMQLY